MKDRVASLLPWRGSLRFWSAVPWFIPTSRLHMLLVKQSEQIEEEAKGKERQIIQKESKREKKVIMKGIFLRQS